MKKGEIKIRQGKNNPVYKFYLFYLLDHTFFYKQGGLYLYFDLCGEK